jgi:hypothetical protein
VDGQPIKDFLVFKQRIAGPMGSHVNVTFTKNVEEAVRTESYVGEPSSSLEPQKRVVTVTRELMRGPAPYIRCLSTSCTCEYFFFLLRVCASASACMFARAVPPKSRSSSSVRVRREISLLQKENDSLRSQVQGALGEGADGQNLVEGLRR